MNIFNFTGINTVGSASTTANYQPNTNGSGKNGAVVLIFKSQ